MYMAAAAQVASALKGSTFIVYCADDRNFAAITTKLHELLPETNMIGTTGFMFEDNGSFAEGIAAIGFEENEAEVYAGTIQDAPTCPINHLPELRDSVEKIHAKYKDKDALCLEFATGYEEELGYTDANIEEGVFKNPLCRIVGAENYITAIFSFNPDRSISTYKNVQKNDLICFTNIEEDYQDYMKNTMKNVVQSGNVAGIISINCILRYLFFENNSYTPAYARMMHEMSGGVHFGMVGDGEQYVEQHVNQSMVCAVFMNGH